MNKSRRTFIKKTATLSAALSVAPSVFGMSAKSYRNILGANDRIQLAIQGLGRRFPAYIDPIVAAENNVQLLYLCDVVKSQREKAAAAFEGKLTQSQPVILENDIRKVLENKELDAVFMATPDHWHSPGACMAMAAGKHVYLEKPCSHNMAENEWLVSQTKYYNKLVQMGNQQRSSLESQHIIAQIHKGIIGETHKAIAFYINQRGAVPNPVKAAVPEGLDWELFQGPAPRRDYTHDSWDYNWHWYGWDFGTAETGNNATHELDIARWALEVDIPEHTSVIAAKNQYKEDGWTMYDSMLASFRFPNQKIIQWDGESRNGYNKYGRGRGTLIYGSQGSVMIDREGYQLYDLKGNLLEDSVAIQKADGSYIPGEQDLNNYHCANFFKAIRGQEALVSPIDQGATSQALTHYANLAYRTQEDLVIDPKTRKIASEPAMALWERPYAAGWHPNK